MLEELCIKKEGEGEEVEKEEEWRSREVEKWRRGGGESGCECVREGRREIGCE